MIFLFVFLLEVALLCLGEKRLWGTFFTPLNFLSFPYTFVTLVAIIYSYISAEIPDFYYPALSVWMLGLFIFFLPSVFFSLANRHKENVVRIIIGKRDDYYRLLLAVALVCIIISFFRIHSTYSTFGVSFGSDEFSEEYEAKGILSHISVLMSAIFSYMIYKVDASHKFAYLVLCLALVGMYAVGVKSWIIAPFLIGYYARIVSGKTKFSVKTILLPAIVCILIFILSYYIIMVVSGKSELTVSWFTFIVNHFVDYLSGGSLSFSLDIEKGILEPEMTKALFAPVINLCNFLIGDKYISSINPVFLSIGSLGETNVRTFMGTIWVYAQNPFIFIMTILLFSIVFYLIFYYSRHSTNLFMVLSNCSDIAFLTLGFFDFYWLTLGAYEITIIFLLLSIISRVTLKTDEYKK